MQKIYIDNNCFTIPDESDMYGCSGNVYELKKDNEIIAAKIYHKDYVIYPKEEIIDIFTNCYSNQIPVLISKYKITDENNKYIGCATDFVTETRGDTLSALKELPTELLIKYLYDIQDTIPFFNNRYISIYDWHLGNIKLGTINNSNKERLYLFDDSYYTLDTNLDNELEFNYLIEDIITRYALLKTYFPIAEIINKMKKENNYLDFLEKMTRGYKNIEECYNDMAKILKK